MNLAEMGNGDTATIVRVDAGKKATGRLCALGFVPGAGIKLVYAARGSGPVLVQVLGSTIAIGRELASKVMVSKLPPPEGGVSSGKKVKENA